MTRKLAVGLRTPRPTIRLAIRIPPAIRRPTYIGSHHLVAHSGEMALVGGNAPYPGGWTVRLPSSSPLPYTDTHHNSEPGVLPLTSSPPRAQVEATRAADESLIESPLKGVPTLGPRPNSAKVGYDRSQTLCPFGRNLEGWLLSAKELFRSSKRPPSWSRSPSTTGDDPILREALSEILFAHAGELARRSFRSG